MAYSTADLESIRQAILELVSGSRAVKVRFADRTVEYAETDLESLRDLEQQVRQEITNNKKRPRQWRIYTDRGV